MTRRLFRVLGLHATWWLLPLSLAADDKTDTFAKQVRPVLVEKCWSCHGEDARQRKGGLDLRTREAAMRGGESGRSAIVPGHPERSPLLLAVQRDSDEWSAMPPKENDRLTKAQVESIKHWITNGAVWSDPQEHDKPDGPGERVHTSQGLSPDWNRRRYDSASLWGYRPLMRPEVPVNQATQPIDAFLDVKRSLLQLTAAPLVDRRTLIRRATFDLIGLPPTPEEMASFVNDPRRDDVAFAAVVERLLASPHYGEQYARHWLDVVRYADSSGFANDFERGNAWRYRDYVVRAFNADRPFDQFVLEQIAGDELLNTSADAVTNRESELLIAVGFLRMGPWELTGMEVAKIARQRFLDDVTDSVGQVFLAHALQCARCHDHKFDPVPTRDYYAIQANFATTQFAEREAPFLPNENTSGFDERRYLEARQQRFESLLKAINAKSEAAGRVWTAERHLPYVSRAEGLRKGIPEDQLPPQRVGLTTDDLGLERIARKGLERLKWELERYEPRAFSVYSGRTPALRSVVSPLRMPAQPMTQGELETTCILAGGDPFSPRDAVVPGVLSVAASEVNRGVDSQDSLHVEGRRLSFARWIASPQNPLTARVIVNRVWSWHFGRGLAGNPNNFGTTGQKPTHPELLDWLASEFIAHGWSIKWLHRQIMLSESYRRSSRHPDPQLVQDRDPQRIGYATFEPRRLSAEELRDAVLRVTGELNLEIGGIPVRPELNIEVALQPRQVMGTFASAWQPSPLPPQRHRRTIYALKLRGLRDPMLEVFNQPSSDQSCERRDESTVTPQVFALFNSQNSLDRAVAFAARLKREDVSLTRDEIVRRAFMLAVSRPPTETELQSCLRHWDAMAIRYAKRPPDTTLAARPREVLREAVEENTGERFQFREPLEMTADFVPDLSVSDLDAETRALADVCLVLLNTNEFLTID